MCKHTQENLEHVEPTPQEFMRNKCRASVWGRICLLKMQERRVKMRNIKSFVKKKRMPVFGLSEGLRFQKIERL